MYDVENWFVLTEFPDYSVSTFGEIMNNKTKRLLKQTKTPRGSFKVGLIKDGLQYSRIVKLLVARTFIYGETEIFDTPINLDGDQRNNRVDNLVWRPRWFALNYTRQFKNPNGNQNIGPVVDVDSGELYETIRSAAIENGLLIDEIFESCISGDRVFPTWQKFTFTK